MLGAAMLPIIGFGAFPTLKPQFFPGVDRDQFYIQVKLADGAAIGDTLEVARKVDRITRDIPQIVSMTWVVGVFVLLPFAAGNFLGPLLLGPLFDRLGRRFMITLTYGLTGILILVTGWLFTSDMLTALSQTLAWSVVFFFASAAASSAYLTVGECFPLEVRAGVEPYASNLKADPEDEVPIYLEDEINIVVILGSSYES